VTKETPTPRKYEKGERRHKHVGKGAFPTIEIDRGDPKKWVGKCPATISEENRLLLLAEAIAAPNGDREIEFDKRLYVVHEGAIYEARTSDDGMSYHGYPYKGRLSGTMLAQLEEMADRKNCGPAFRDWVKKHIVRHGERK
jgi:hypothetical protein